MKINKRPSQQPLSNSAFTVSTSSLVRSLKQIFDNAAKIPAPSSKKRYSLQRVCRDLKDLFKPFISH